ncbi:hypothetical protein Btru_001151 [Bulinus truncatus]|nr:hypothetical protein Btru_001151 [Bulinus truncatus]
MTHPMVSSTTTVQSSTGGETSGIEKQILGPLRVWHIVAIVCTVVLTGLVIFCYCYDYRIPRSRAEIEENHRKRQMNKKYLFILERRPDDLLTKPQEVLREHFPTVPTPSNNVRTTASTSPRTAPPSSSKANIPSNTRVTGVNKSPNVRSDALNKVRNAVRATTHQKTASSGAGQARSSRSKHDPDYFTSAVKPRPKTGVETPLASHPRDLLSLMNQMKRKGPTERE